MRSITFIIIGAGVALAGCGSSERPAEQAKSSDSNAENTASPLALMREPYDKTQVAKTVSFWEGQVRRDPQSPLSMMQLAGAYLQRQRETGDDSYAERAEKTIRRALQIAPNQPDMTLRLGRSLLAQHRFKEALVCADKVVKIDPQAHRLRADALSELGRYDEAVKAVSSVPRDAADPGLQALYAHVNALRGQQEIAFKHWDTAVQLAENNSSLPAESAAWFYVRRGQARLMAAMSEQAERDFQKALEIFPGDYRAMEALVNLYARRRDWKNAVAWGEKLLPLASDPDVRFLLGECYQGLGQSEKARKQWQMARSDAKKELKDPGTHARHLVLYLADTNQHLPEALRLAQRDTRSRADIYTWDTLSWLAYKNKRFDEAKKASDKALTPGTRDAMLWYHAGMIATAHGDLAGAKANLSRALEINPQFHHKYADEARATLKTL
jgi:tetratricopeptide (TPR) repeat protein